MQHDNLWKCHSGETWGVKSYTKNKGILSHRQGPNCMHSYSSEKGATFVRIMFLNALICIRFDMWGWPTRTKAEITLCLYKL